MAHNFQRPALPYAYKSLPFCDRYQVKTKQLEEPPTDLELDTDLNYIIDGMRQLDADIAAVQAGEIIGVDDPNNKDTVSSTDGEGNINWIFITSDNVLDNSLLGKKMVASTITSRELGAGCVTAAKVSDQALPWSKIDIQDEDIPLSAIEIPNNSIPGSKITNNGISLPQMAENSVGTSQLVLGSVTVAKLAQAVLDMFIPIGTIIEFAGTTGVSANFLECNGQAVSRTTYSTLFTNIGTEYGNGDGSTTFNLPDRRGRTAVGIGSDNSTNGLITNATAAQIALGKTFGEETHTLITPELPSHNHSLQSFTINNVSSGGSFSDMLSYDETSINAKFTANTGGGQPHNNTQPSIFERYYIRAL